jgi:magnesium-transporting ATPase (P-type)
MGFYSKRTSDTITLEVKGRETTFKVLKTFPFTSDRKAMSIIVEQPDKKVMLYTKGAD